MRYGASGEGRCRGVLKGTLRRDGTPPLQAKERVRFSEPKLRTGLSVSALSGQRLVASPRQANVTSNPEPPRKPGPSRELDMPEQRVAEIDAERPVADPRRRAKAGRKLMSQTKLL